MFVLAVMSLIIAFEIAAIAAVIVAHRRHKTAEFDGGFTQNNPPRVTRIRADHIIKEE